MDWTKKDTYAGILTLYHDLIKLRRNTDNSTAGLRGSGVQVHHVNNADKVIGYHRWVSGGIRDDTVVVLNFAYRSYDAYTIGFPRAGIWTVRFNSDWAGYDDSFTGHATYDCQTRESPRDGLPWSGDIGIGPYTAIILSQNQ